jgi:hypothetical protein
LSSKTNLISEEQTAKTEARAKAVDVLIVHLQELLQDIKHRTSLLDRHKSAIQGLLFIYFLFLFKPKPHFMVD